MIRKKRGLMTLIWSFIPGAGEMYMGFFKQGISIMTIFFLLFSLASGLNLGALIFILPIIWFYSFFHVQNLASMQDEEFYSLEDRFLFIDECGQISTRISPEKGRNLLAALLIVVGVTSLWDIFMNIIDSFIIAYFAEPYIEMFYSFRNRTPKAVFAVLIILLGIHLIKGKKEELLLEEKRLEEESNGVDLMKSFYENVNEAGEDFSFNREISESEDRKDEDA